MERRLAAILVTDVLGFTKSEGVWEMSDIEWNSQPDQFKIDPTDLGVKLFTRYIFT